MVGCGRRHSWERRLVHPQDRFTQNAPPELPWRATRPTAADFSGSGSADLLFFYAIPEPGDEGATAYRVAYQIRYEPDSSDPYWGEVLGADVPVTSVPTSLVLGPVDMNTTALVRMAAAAAFRGAAAVTQARDERGNPAAATS